MIYVARQLRHNARYTLGTYGHVIDDLDDQPRVSAEDAIRAARTRRDQAGPLEVAPPTSLAASTATTSLV